MWTRSPEPIGTLLPTPSAFICESADSEVSASDVINLQLSLNGLEFVLIFPANTVRLFLSEKERYCSALTSSKKAHTLV